MKIDNEIWFGIGLEELAKYRTFLIYILKMIRLRYLYVIQTQQWGLRNTGTTLENWKSRELLITIPECVDKYASITSNISSFYISSSVLFISCWSQFCCKLRAYTMPPPSPLPKYIWKILDSDPSPLPEGLPLSDLDRGDGYIHLSTPDQVGLILSRSVGREDSDWTRCRCLRHVVVSSLELAPFTCSRFHWNGWRLELNGMIIAMDVFLICTTQTLRMH